MPKKQKVNSVTLEGCGKDKDLFALDEKQLAIAKHNFLFLIPTH
jgi:hypothetical protein